MTLFRLLYITLLLVSTHSVAKPSSYIEKILWRELSIPAGGQ